MTIQNVFEQFYHIDREAAVLLRETGYAPVDELGEEVCHLPDPYEDAFLRENAEDILQALDHIHSILRYLKMPSHEEHILRRLPGGRFGYRDGGRIREFSSGDCLEAKLCDERGNPCWAASVIEHDGTDYYLAGFRGIPLNGLTVRERG